MNAMEKMQVILKWGQLLKGEKIITNDKELDAILAVYGEDERHDRLVSVFNPNRCGILDQYVAWIKQPHNTQGG